MEQVLVNAMPDEDSLEEEEAAAAHNETVQNAATVPAGEKTQSQPPLENMEDIR